MKKSIFFVAAATMILGLASCTDEPIIDPIVDPVVVDTPMVKSVDDLKGTEWTYTLSIEPIEFEDETLDLSMEFGLNFDESYAHLTFPEDVTILNVTDDYTVEEIENMEFAYTYDATTTSGTLATSELEIPFRYDEATDAILIDMMLADSFDETQTETVTIVFHRK